MVLTGKDLAELGTIPLKDIGYHGIYPNLECFTHPVLAVDRVRYVDQPVVAVLAEDPYVAEAAELVDVDSEPLPVLLDPTSALTSDVKLFDDLGNKGARIEKAKRLASEMLEVAEGDLELVDGALR